MSMGIFVFACKKEKVRYSCNTPFLELIIRFELMTSSLPMTCSTN